MRIILIGPPGAGKGTQSQHLAQSLGISHISTGEVLRQEVAANTTLGQSAQRFISHGRLVPDEIIFEIIEHRLNQPDCTGGFLLDGFPRTLDQAKQLHIFLEKHGLQLDGAIELQVESAELLRRLSARKRADDQLEIIHERIATYHRVTEPMLDYYLGMNYLQTINGMGTMDTVFERLCAAVNSLPKRRSSSVAYAK